MYILLYLNYDQMPAMLQANNIDELNQKIGIEFPDYMTAGTEMEEISETMTLFELDSLTRLFEPRQFELLWRPHISM